MNERPIIYIGEGLKKAYDSFKSPVVLRSEYDSLRQEFIRTLIELNGNLYPERQEFCFNLIEVKLRELGGFSDS